MNPIASSSSIVDQLPPEDAPSSRTVRRRLMNLHSYAAAKKPKLYTKNIKDRISFAKKYRH